MRELELWKPIEGFEYYEVSNYGRVRSLDRYVRGASNSTQLKRGRILKPCVSKNGYYLVVLDKKSKSVHRLVAIAFIPNPYNLPCVNHKDENKLNNFVNINENGTVDLEKSNLEWCDHKYNMNYGTVKKRISEKHINNKYQSKQVNQFDLDGKLIKIWPSLAEIKRKLGYSQGVIWDCCNNRRYRKTAYGFKWSYAV